MISNSVFKNHLLFFSHLILALCICSIPFFNYAKTHIDGMIALMSFTWDSMVVECVIHPPLLTTATNIPKPAKAFILLTNHEHDTLKHVGGCYWYHCTPASSGCIKHRAHDCPGDEANGILPAMAAIVEEDANDSDSDFITVVMPFCVLGSRSFLEGEEEANRWNY